MTRALYAKRTQFPFNFYYPSTYQKAAHDIISVMGGFDIDDKLEDHDVDYVSMILMKYEKKQLMQIFFYKPALLIPHALTTVMLDQ